MDAGGKIRTANILKHLKGGRFEIDLISPASNDQYARWSTEIGELCDRFSAWRPPDGAEYAIRRCAAMLTTMPVSVFGEINAAAKQAVESAIARAPDLIVFDYAHSRALAQRQIAPPSLIFAHNVETEIFRRHASQTELPMKFVWKFEAAKMHGYERRAIRSVDGIIAVSDRDAEAFKKEYGAQFSRSIPTGVDLDYFSYRAPQANDAPVVIFTGSMDWRANQDGLEWFMDAVWPMVARDAPQAEFVAVGKNPPQALVERAKQRGLNWRFTGFVDDVREHARGAAYVIPLRVGGGTRIKAFEAMAMGVPVVSTSLGVEGLPVTAGEHFLCADDEKKFAKCIVSLLRNYSERARLAGDARRLVEKNFGHEAAASAFERHCLEILDKTAPEN